MMLLTDSGFYYDNELDKPLTLLIDRFGEMLQKPFAETKVLFVPTAAMQDEAKAAAITSRLKNELLTMGIPDRNITIHDIDGTLSEAESLAYDVIYITGGNTPYLAKRVKADRFDAIIKTMLNANKVYVGMSAGSMLLAPSFNTDDLRNSLYESLGLIQFYFDVHCKPGTPNRHDLPLPHIAMQENQAIEVVSDKYKLLEGNLQYE